jgi:hypothetical protein
MKERQSIPVADNAGRVKGAGGTFSRIPLLITALVFFSCPSKEGALEDAPIITSATYQHTQYNGRNQAVEVSAARDNAPPFIITYFRSEAELE